MNRLNAEGHDESQYTKKVFNPKLGKYEMPPIVNAFRAAKGDIILNSDDQHESPTWLPRIMYLGNRLDKNHYDISVSVERIWIHASRTLGICDIKGRLFDSYPGGIDNNTDSFLEIRRALPRNEFIEIIWFIEKHMNARSAALPLNRLGVILHGLENAKIVIDILAGIHDTSTSTSPEVRPESPAQQ